MLGESLLDSGAITAGQLDEALAAQRTSGSLLGDVLLSMQFVSDETLSRALAREAGLPFVDSRNVRVDPSVATLVPEGFARRHLLVPIGTNGPSLEVMQANPFDVVAVDDLSHLVRQPIVAFCATPAEVKRAIERCYRPRLSAPARTTRPISGVGLSRKQEAQVLALLEVGHGLMVVAGPAGAGKRTTVESALSWLSASGRRAVSCGEITDATTAAAAVQAARAGALVLATMRRRNVVDAVATLSALPPDPHQLALELLGVVAQRLVRVLCPACAAPAGYPVEQLTRVGLGPDPGVVLHRGLGCGECGGTGYRGRTGVFEVLAVDPGLRDAIGNASSGRIADVTRGALGSTMLDEALTAALFGRTTIEEVDAIANDVG